MHGVEPTAEGKRPRVGRIGRKEAGLPAEFVPGALPPDPPALAAGRPGVFDPSAVAEAEQIWWLNSRAETYFIPGHGDSWRELNRGNVVDHLRKLGLSHRGEDGALSEVARVLLYVRESRVLDAQFSGLAGHSAGIYTFTGQRVLVRSSPTILQPVRSDKGWPTINALLQGLLGPEAFWYFLAWVKLGYESLRNGTRDRGQICIIVGPAGCGKSRIQHFILTPIFGGRSADPQSFIFGEDRFNAELSKSEHLLCEDPAVIYKAEVKAHLKERLKSLAVNDSFRISAKFSDAINLSPWWRVSMSLNSDPDTMRLLPALTDDWRDKVLLFRAVGGAMPMPTVTPAEKEAFRAAIRDELPAFLADLVDDHFWAACPHVRGGRFGSREYADPEICSRLTEGTADGQLLELIEAGLFSESGLIRDCSLPWEGSADDLENALTTDVSPVGPSARRLFRNGSCSRLLARLAEDRPERVERCRNKHRRWWRIMPPAEESQNPN